MNDHVVGFDHVQLAMPAGEESAAEAFYAGVLGLARVPKPEPLASRGGCWFEAPGAAVHLGIDTDFRPARKAHPAFRIRDLDRLVAALAAAGHRVSWDAELPAVRRCNVEDPFGNRIELIQD
jgi:catechol 2,3-dioxygenase-like lactoylglutathione lyase family enzyme